MSPYSLARGSDVALVNPRAVRQCCDFISRDLGCSRPEVKPPPGKLKAALAIGMCALLASATSVGQTTATLESVRLHRRDALALAESELAACQPKSGPSLRPCDNAPRLNLLTGYLRLASGDACGALELLNSRPPAGSLAPFHAFYLGEAQFYCRARAKSVESFDRAADGAPDWLAARARARKAEALVALGRYAEALPLLDTALSERESAELYFHRALARSAQGDDAGEKADLEKLSLAYATHPYGHEAYRRLESLKQATGLFTLEERLQRVDRFVEAGAPTDAQSELQRIAAEKLATQPVDKARVQLASAVVFGALGRDQDAAKALEGALKGPSAVAAEALLFKARREVKADRHPQAQRLFKELERRFPKEPAASEAAFLSGWLDLQDGRLPEAIAAFDAFDKRKGYSRKRDEAVWYAGLARLLRERHSEARATFERLVQRFPRSGLVPQARYWAVRAQHLALKEGESAQGLVPQYEQVIALFPGSLYASLSIERLRELNVPAASLPFPRPASTTASTSVAPAPTAVSPSGPGPEVGELKLARALSEAGLVADAREEVQARASRISGTERALAFAQALLSISEYGQAQTLAIRQLWGAAYGARSPEALAVMYPLAYRASVERHAQAYSVDRFFVWAIMRRESGFRPEVQSAADARGLMQLIPATSSAIAQELQVPPPDPDELFGPDLNIQFASWYLAALLERFGHPAVAAAAYNAGPRPVAKWVRDRGTAPLDLWVELVPFKETRAYVKQVTADYYLYQALYGPERSSQNLSLTVPSSRDGGVDF